MVRVIRRVIPGGPAIDAMLRRRILREAEAIRKLRVTAIAELHNDIEQALKKAARFDKVWTARTHARAVQAINEAGIAYGRRLSAIAHASAVAEWPHGAKDYMRALAVQVKAKTGVHLRIPKVDVESFRKRSEKQASLRTANVGAHTGRDLATRARALSHIDSMKESPRKIAAVARDIANQVTHRAEWMSERVITTEMTAAASDAALAVGRALQTVATIGKQWDASHDRKTCGRCRDLHGVVVAQHEDFPGAEAAPPLHPHCRCGIIPTVMDWRNIVSSMTEAG